MPNLLLDTVGVAREVTLLTMDNLGVSPVVHAGPVPLHMDNAAVAPLTGTFIDLLMDNVGIATVVDTPVPLIMDDFGIATIGPPPEPLVFLDWSDDRAHTWGNPVGQPMGKNGEYLTSIQWQRLGYARDRVFRITWSTPVATALLGAFIEADTSPKS